MLFVLSSLLSTAGACSAAAALLLNRLSAARLCVGRAGPLLSIIFAVITWHYSVMLVDAYRYPTVDGPTRNYTYIEAVDRYLGAKAWAVHPCTHLGLIPPLASGHFATHTPGLTLTLILHADAVLVFSCVLADRSAIHGVLRHRPGADSGTLCPPGAHLLLSHCMQKLG